MKKSLTEMLETNADIKCYFDSLSKNTQEILMQSTIKIESLQELKDCVYNLNEDYLK